LTKDRTSLPRTARSRARHATGIAALVAVLAALVLPTAVSAHPLGNFTINRYNGLTVGTEGVVVDRVVDMAEIPALQARQSMDVDADGAVSDTEAAAWADTSCRQGATDLRTSVDGAAVALTPTALGLTFPGGQAGLLTLRLVCTYQGSYPIIVAPAAVDFRDASFAGRIGWREIVVRGDGLTIAGADELSADSSDRLRSYPPDLLDAPRADDGARFTVTPGGAPASAPPITDAVPIGSDAALVLATPDPTAAQTGRIDDLARRLTEIVEADELTPPAVGLALLVALLVGALHAASPGHGKTLMAAYLVGSRGTARHAVGLGLTVTISHTIGVLLLGALVVFAGAVVPAERLFPVLGLVSGVLVTALGAVLLAQRIREARRARHHAHDHAHGNDHADGNDHKHANDADEAAGWHSHGAVRHTHLPPTGTDGDNPLRWRNLAALGLVGGLVPSASAILILVGSVAIGRPAFGMLLTVAFGVGMAFVLVGVGVALVHARNIVERWPGVGRLSPVFARLPLATAVLFVVVGASITLQSGAQLP
jgi:ABC-type nickel/cobalt efflux system permease component RcnA